MFAPIHFTFLFFLLLFFFFLFLFGHFCLKRSFRQNILLLFFFSFLHFLPPHSFSSLPYFILPLLQNSFTIKWHEIHIIPKVSQPLHDWQESSVNGTVRHRTQAYSTSDWPVRLVVWPSQAACVGAMNDPNSELGARSTSNTPHRACSGRAGHPGNRQSPKRDTRALDLGLHCQLGWMNVPWLYV